MTESKPILHLFWIAEYQDGTALPQFDPDTGDEHLFSEIDQARLKRFGWYSFPYEMVKKIPEAVFNPALNHYVLNLNPDPLIPNPKLVAYRTTTLNVTMDGQPKKHEADEYVLGLTCHCEERSSGRLEHPLQLLMHIFSDGRVELK